MKTNDTQYFKSKSITIMDDPKILNQLPQKIQQKLGTLVDSGFHLGETRRDLFFSNGVVQYKLGSDRIAVTFE